MGGGFDWSVLWTGPYREQIGDAILVTLQLSLTSWVFALAIGICVGVARESPSRIARILSAGHVEVFRNIPLLVQLFFVYYVLPRALPPEWRQELFRMGWEIGSAILTLSLYTSAKVAEHIRAGLNAVSLQIRQGALATGLTWWQAQRHVVLPLVLRLALPSLTSEFVTVFKSSSLAMTVGVVEVAGVTQQLGLETFRWIEANTVGTMIYLACAWTVALAMALLARVVRFPGFIRAGEPAR